MRTAGTAPPPDTSWVNARVICAAAPCTSSAVLVSVPSTSSWACATRPRRISRSKCSGRISAPRAFPPATTVSGDIATGSPTIRKVSELR